MIPPIHPNLCLQSLATQKRIETDSETIMIPTWRCHLQCINGKKFTSRYNYPFGSKWLKAAKQNKSIDRNNRIPTKRMLRCSCNSGTIVWFLSSQHLYSPLFTLSPLFCFASLHHFYCQMIHIILQHALVILRTPSDNISENYSNHIWPIARTSALRSASFQNDAVLWFVHINVKWEFKSAEV